ncbi:MAG: 16S rRNA (adenine(1518)-N(6)/adenine(1519)-N(6))-dimethyltransferase RsmA [bacterium]
MKGNKSLGQHFLQSEKALSQIIDAGDPVGDDLILEIGPGQGVLTERLLKFAGKVIAVEKDGELCDLLKKRFANAIEKGRLDLVHGDILNFDPNLLSFYKDLGYKIIANIPYNITGAILKKFLSAEYLPETMVLLVQKEVARRIVARDKKPLDSARGKESILSISVKAYGKPRYVDTVKAGSFSPPPKVDSAILAIENISKEFFENMAKNNNLGVQLLSVERGFFDLLHAGFSSKRKKLSSNLSSLLPKERVRKAFADLNMDENTRAEDVDIKTWQKLAIKLLV